MVVLMVMTVEAGEATEVGSTLIRSDGTFPVLGESNDIVIECGEHPVMEIVHPVGNMIGLASMPACSKLLLVMSPVGLLVETLQEGRMLARGWGPCHWQRGSRPCQTW